MQTSDTGKDRRVNSFLDEVKVKGLISHENLLEDVYERERERERNRTTQLDSENAKRLSKHEATSTSLSGMAKTYQDIEKELLGRRDFISNTSSNVMRNNFVDPHELPFNKTKPEEHDQLSVGSTEHKHLGVVREGFKKASFSNLA